MKTIRGKLFIMYFMVFLALGLMLISTYVSNNVNEQHRILSDMLADYKLHTQRITLKTVNLVTLRASDEARYQEVYADYVKDLEESRQVINEILDAFSTDQVEIDGEIIPLDFSDSDRMVFHGLAFDASDGWENAYSSITNLTDQEMGAMTLDADLLTNLSDMNQTLTDSVNKITEFCVFVAEEEADFASILQIGAVIFAVFVFIWLIIFVQYSIRRPIYAIRNVFKKMGDGDYNVRLDHKVDDEFKHLFDDFNRFIDNRNTISRIEDHILSEDNLRLVLKEMKKEFRQFVPLEVISIVYRDSEGNVIKLNSEDLFVEMISELQEYKSIICLEPTVLTMPINVNGVYLGYAEFYKTNAYSESDIKFVEGLETTIAFTFYKSLVFKDLLSIITSGLADLTESRDPETRKHLIRMSYYSQIIARKLFEDNEFKDEIDEEYIENIKLAAPMHDIGKVSVPDSILLKPGKLTVEEFEIMKTHTCEGAKVIKGIHSRFETYNIMYFKMAEDIAHYHQEKFNGSGYPEAVAGSDIPLSARICAVADVFDALTSKRPYKEAFSLDKSYGIIKESSGSHFDPRLVKAFFDSQEAIEKIYYEFREI